MVAGVTLFATPHYREFSLDIVGYADNLNPRYAMYLALFHGYRAFMPLGLQKAYSAWIGPKREQAVFLWIPKSAGSSVWTALQKYHCPKLRDPWEVRFCFCQKGLVTFGHQSYWSLFDLGLISEGFHQRSFKFAFVRNPYDRAISLWGYLKRVEWIPNNLSFRTFAYLLQDRAFPPVGPYHVKGLSHCNPQVCWLKNPEGKIFADYVGKLENINEDFANICKRLDIEVELPHLNKTSHKPYQEYYDEETKEIIGRVYAEDLSAFGYTFEESTRQSA